jgi:hypothetical protein
MIMHKNDQLAYQALDHIRDHPLEWDQDSYIMGTHKSPCGTTACFAGRVLLIAFGNQVAVSHAVHQLEDYRLDRWADKAAEVLGWNTAEANHVFYCWTKDFATLEHRVKQVLNGEIKPW